AGPSTRLARGAVDLESDSVDRVLVDLLADARLVADALRGGPRRKLLPRLLKAARDGTASLRGHDFSWQRCRGLLLASSDACAAGDPLHPGHHSLHGPDRRRGDPARSATRSSPPVPHVALSAARDHRSGAVVLHRHFAAERIEGGRAVRDRRGDTVLCCSPVAGATSPSIAREAPLECGALAPLFKAAASRRTPKAHLNAPVARRCCAREELTP